MLKRECCVLRDTGDAALGFAGRDSSCCCLSRRESCPWASPLLPCLPSLCLSLCWWLPDFPDSFLRSCLAFSAPVLLFLAKGLSQIPAEQCYRNQQLTHSCCMQGHLLDGTIEPHLFRQ